MVEMKPSKVEELLKLGQEPLSLESPVGAGDDPARLADFIEDEDHHRPDAQVAKLIRDADVQGVLDNLPPRERRVIELRYGLDPEGPMTLEDIGKVVGLTRERVRQIEVKTLQMLKTSGQAAKLEGMGGGPLARSHCFGASSRAGARRLRRYPPRPIPGDVMATFLTVNQAIVVRIHSGELSLSRPQDAS